MDYSWMRHELVMQTTLSDFEIKCQYPNYTFSINEPLPCKHPAYGYAGSYPLHLMCRYGRLDLVLWLLFVHKADLNVQDAEGFTPLHRCLKALVKGENYWDRDIPFGHFCSKEMVVKQNPGKFIYPDQDNPKMGPQQIVAQQIVEIFWLLVNQGASLTIPNNAGERVVDCDLVGQEYHQRIKNYSENLLREVKPEVSTDENKIFSWSFQDMFSTLGFRIFENWGTGGSRDITQNHHNYNPGVSKADFSLFPEKRM